MNRLKELRLHYGYTQQELAKKLDLNQTAVGKYEREQLEPSLQTLKNLSVIFECSIDYLIGHSDDFGSIVLRKSDEPLLNAEEKRLLEIFRRLSVENQLRLSVYAELRLEDQNSP